MQDAKGFKTIQGGEAMTRLICAPMDRPEMIYLPVGKPKMSRWRNWIRAWNDFVIAAFRRARLCGQRQQTTM